VSDTPPILRAGGRDISCAEPLLMGIVNATPDSFSDAGLHRSLLERVALAHRLVADGADFIDIGGESGVTNRPAVAVADEIERVVPLIERVGAELDVKISVDTYKPAVARAAIAAGACLVNDVSGLRDPELADVCAQTGAGLVIMHTRARPKQKLLDPSYDGRIRADVTSFLAERIAIAIDRGVSESQIVLDPGPDFAKTPAQTVDVLAALADLRAFARPVLLAVSRKDFIGALTGRAPRERLAGTLAAIGHGVQAGAHLLRVHDVAAAHDYLLVRAALRRELEVAPELRLADAVRWQQGDGPNPGAAPPEPLDS
jgi:dihydropteroate synthase